MEPARSIFQSSYRILLCLVTFFAVQEIIKSEYESTEEKEKNHE